MKYPIYYCENDKRGKMMASILKMLSDYSDKIEWKYYSDEDPTPVLDRDVVVGVNDLPLSALNFKRKVLFLGAINKFLEGSMSRQSNLGCVDHVIFISDYFKNIILSKWKVKEYSVILPFDGMPSDFSDFSPLETRKIEGPIHFMAIAKWYKRPYKRQRQTITLFKDFLEKEYPGSYLHLVGCEKETFSRGNIIYHHKTFHKEDIIELFKKCHVQIILTPFDTGPHTLAESIRYNVPFVCSNNCSGLEYISRYGRKGVVVNSDPLINSFRSYVIHNPMMNKRFYDKELCYSHFVKAIKEIIDNYEIYTSNHANVSKIYIREAKSLCKSVLGDML